MVNPGSRTRAWSSLSKNLTSTWWARGTWRTCAAWKFEGWRGWPGTSGSPRRCTGANGAQPSWRRSHRSNSIRTFLQHSAWLGMAKRLHLFWLIINLKFWKHLLWLQIRVREKQNHDRHRLIFDVKQLMRKLKVPSVAFPAPIAMSAVHSSRG